jgi:hypothetical protein
MSKTPLDVILRLMAVLTLAFEKSQLNYNEVQYESSTSRQVTWKYKNTKNSNRKRSHLLLPAAISEDDGS